MKAHRFGVVFIAIVTTLFVWIPGAGLRLEAQPANNDASSKLSPDLAKVAKLVESGMAEDVVLAYVRNSPVPKPDADEIISLHQAGVPNSVITALLSKNGTASKPTISEPANSKPVTEQPTSAPATAAYVDRSPTYAQTQPAVVYAPSYAPPYYSYPSYYPDYYPYYGSYYNSWPAISLGFRFGGYYGYGHHHHGYHYGGHHRNHGGYHGGRHHSGHGGLRYASHSGRRR